MESFDPEKTRQTLGSLPGWRRIIFMAACCERMLPNYQRFSVETGYGDADRLARALAVIWLWVETSQFPRDVGSLIRDCDELAPDDVAAFSSIYTSAALDAANAVAVTLEALNDASEDRALEVASLARDTVDLFVQQMNDLDPNDRNIERQIIESPLMQLELRKQRQSLERLKNSVGERDVIAAEIRSEFSGNSLLVNS